MLSACRIEWAKENIEVPAVSEPSASISTRETAAVPHPTVTACFGEAPRRTSISSPSPLAAASRPTSSGTSAEVVPALADRTLPCPVSVIRIRLLPSRSPVIAPGRSCR